MLTQRLYHFVIFTILTFSLHSVYSQEVLSIEKNAKKVSEGSIMGNGFFLLPLPNEPDTLEGLKVVKRFSGTDYVVGYFFQTINPAELSSGKIYSLQDYQDWKLAPGLRKKGSKGNLYAVSVRDPEKFRKTWGSKVLFSYNSQMVLRISAEEFQELKKDEQVSFIEAYTAPKAESAVSGHDLTVNSISYANDQFPNFQGEDIKVSVMEELFDTTDIDLRNRYVLFGKEASTFSQHATDIASLICGGGNSSWKGKGTAPAATLTSSSFLSLLPEEDSFYTNHQVYLQNHSYGTGIESFYGTEAAAYDQNVMEVPYLLHVFSSGNSGLETPEDGRYAGMEHYSNLTGNFKMAKNILTVGAVDSEKKLIDRSSRGPAYDGRVKPELVAYATTGTSDAAALVSGSAMLLQELYKGKEDLYPRADLLKALLIAGAEDVGKKHVDFGTGYGNLNTYNSLQILNSDHFFTDSISEGQLKAHSLAIPEGVAELKLVLCWSDPAANPGDEKALVNDLDIAVANESGENWLPWVLDPRPEFLEEEAVRKRDSLNPVEVISIDDPAAGNYQLSVTPHGVLQGGKQKYAVAYFISMKDQFRWTFPNSSTPVISGERSRLRWDSSFTEAKGKLEVNINNSGWQVLAEQVELGKGSYELDTGGLAGRVVLKMSIGDREFLSEEFAIAPALTSDIEFNCGESIGFSWPQVEGATKYILQNLGDKYLQDLEETAGNYYTVSKSEILSPYFSVIPVFDGKRGANGLTVDYSQQGVNCYFKNFYAFLVDENSVTANLNLSSTRNVSQVELIRKNGAEEVVFGHFEAPFDQLTISSEDTELPTGNNEYYAVISLEDGDKIETGKVQIFVPDETTFSIYPNPVRPGEEVHVLSKGDDLDYQIFDMSGRRLSEDTLIQFHDRIPMRFLARGIYIVRALRGEKVVGIKKLIVL